MEQVLQFINEYIAPLLITLVGAVGVPSIITLIKIIKDGKGQAKTNNTIKSSIGVVVNVSQEIVKNILNDYESELIELEQELNITFNKKQKDLIVAKIERVKNRIEYYKSLNVGELVNKATETVKVKVIKKWKTQ